MVATLEQQRIIEHDPTRHARVVAGPGTGKSWTSVSFLERLSQHYPDLRCRMLTFTRAATAEFARSLGDSSLHGLGVSPPATVHAFALSVLMKSSAHGLPMPLRIPDHWETRSLLRPALADRLREQGHQLRVTLIDKLEGEMAAGWQSLDPDHILLADLDPDLRAAYVGAWKDHRSRFGYVALSELPYRAGQLIEDAGWQRDLDVVLVDEYQDLNEADIKLIRLVAAAGVSVLAIGDDDQSIYSWRNAAPHGIRRFLDEFDTDCDYTLSFSRRCGGQLLERVAEFIASAPDRQAKPPLRALDEAPDSRIFYARFHDEAAEAEGVARMVAARVAVGVPPGEIAVLARTNISRWANTLRPAFEAHGVNLASTDWVSDALNDDNLRRRLAVAHLVRNPEDSIAWWSLLHLTRGVGSRFIRYVEDSCQPNERFGVALLRLHADEFVNGPAGRTAAINAVARASELAEQLFQDPSPDATLGWGGWLLDIPYGDHPGDAAQQLLTMAGKHISPSEGLAYFLSQLQPVGRELAVNAQDGVRLITMGGSKGLTVNSAFVMGVEDGLVPKPDADPNEERRLLYVAMTRATHLCLMTYAARRRSPIAYQGQANLGPRRRCSLLEDLPVGHWRDGIEVMTKLEREAQQE